MTPDLDEEALRAAAEAYVAACNERPGHRNALCEAILAYLAVKDGEAGRQRGWLSIETAPRDGTRVLLSCGPSDPIDGHTQAFMACGFWFDYARDAPLESGYQWAGWVDTYGAQALTEPTHWTPVPAPPPSPSEGRQTPSITEPEA